MAEKNPAIEREKDEKWKEDLDSVEAETLESEESIEGELDESGAAGDDDYSWLMRGYATVTALQADMTDYKGTELFRKILG